MPLRSPEELRRNALEIWRAGVAAVDSTRLVEAALVVDGGRLVVDDDAIELAGVGRIIVVGCGKAGAGMAAGVEGALGDELARKHELAGWVNVPDDCVRRLKTIELHGARPAGRNEPTEAGVLGTIRMLELVEAAGPDDLVICLISGGGSALMPAPIKGVSLADKQAVTKFLSGAGANIAELNTVRKALSRVKGGGLARSCRAGRLISIVISDVLGDPLDVIASGPTVPSTTTAADALSVLERFGARQAGVPAAVFAALERRRNDPPPPAPACRVTNLVVGNNATAVDAAGVVAERLGYSHAMVSARAPEGAAEEVGRHLAEMAVRMRSTAGPDCLISGGEPTVTLAPEGVRGRGGRNQQLVLAGLETLVASGSTEGVVLLSGGTDGEDGPTDATGAIVEPATAAEAARQGLVPADYLRRNDAYTFFESLGGLIKTGPTHTNVCDVRVVVVSRPD